MYTIRDIPNHCSLFKRALGKEELQHAGMLLRDIPPHQHLQIEIGQPERLHCWFPDQLVAPWQSGDVVYYLYVEEVPLSRYDRQVYNMEGDTKLILLPGLPLGTYYPVGYEEYKKSDRLGVNYLRTEKACQPRVIKKGDVLANGDRILSDPREAGNGDVWLRLSGSGSGYWVEVSSQLPLALMGPEKY